MQNQENAFAEGRFCSGQRTGY